MQWDIKKKIQNTMYLFSQEVRKILGEDLCKIIVYGSQAEDNTKTQLDILTKLMWQQKNSLRN